MAILHLAALHSLQRIIRSLPTRCESSGTKAGEALRTWASWFQWNCGPALDDLDYVKVLTVRYGGSGSLMSWPSKQAGGRK